MNHLFTVQMLEFNFDGLVGPTHNYAGLSYGNVASTRNRALPSSPRAAALQGLAKARALALRGIPQAVLPPHERPSIQSLRAWGFPGKTDAEVLASTRENSPVLLAAASSASAMWTANACTVTPSCDSADGRLHLTPANLFGNLHRSIEASFTHVLLKAVFSDESRFTVHAPLSGGEAMADEGAANHTRLEAINGEPGLHVFVFGRSVLNSSLPSPRRFPARQTLESVQAIARLHQLPAERSLFLQQSPEAIDAGVFHNDVISIGNRCCFLYHERAFEDPEAVRILDRRFRKLTGESIRLVCVPESEVSLEEAVRTYLFNSQLLQDKSGKTLLVTPAECTASDSVSALLDRWVDDPANPVDEVLSFDLRESMRNGGGPACLRQRIPLTRSEQTALSGRLVLDDGLYQDLVGWINRFYRESLSPGDLADPGLLEESRQALDSLTQILELPSIYPFQKV